MHVLRTNCAAVGVLQNLQDFAQRFLATPTGGAGVELLIEIRIGELEIVQIQLRQLFFVEAQRINVRDVVPQGPVGEQQVREVSLPHRIHRRQCCSRLRCGDHRCGDPVALAAAIESLTVRLKLRPQFKPLEERAPSGVHARWVHPPLLVLLLEQVGVFRMANLAARFLTFLVGKSGDTPVAYRRFHAGQSRCDRSFRQYESDIV